MAVRRPRYTTITSREAVETLKEMKLSAAALYIHRHRGTGPRCIKRDGRLYYKLSDLITWAEKFTGKARLDLRGTALGDWLHERRLTVPAFARRLGIGPFGVYKLVGHENAALRNRPQIAINSDILELIGLETGIGVGTLVEDALRAARERANGA